MFKPSILICVSVIAVLVILSSVTFGDPEPSPEVGTPKTLDQIPLVQAFHGKFFFSNVSPLRVTLPLNGGLAITGITYLEGDKDAVIIKVNGVEVYRGTLYPQLPLLSENPSNPPLVIYPGATLEITYVPGGNWNSNIVISGYFLTLADFGLE